MTRLAWLAHDDLAALDRACDVCLSYTDVDLGIRGRAIGLLARVLSPDLPADQPSEQAEEWGAGRPGEVDPGLRGNLAPVGSPR
jgi:hypothetical protein